MASNQDEGFRPGRMFQNRTEASGHDTEASGHVTNASRHDTEALGQDK